jgi:hypothetical protein
MSMIVGVVTPSSLRIVLDERGHLTTGGASRRPFVVEVGEAVVDPDGGCVAEPGIDVIAFPEIPVGVAGGDLRASEVYARQGACTTSCRLWGLPDWPLRRPGKV